MTERNPPVTPKGKPIITPAPPPKAPPSIKKSDMTRLLKEMREARLKLEEIRNTIDAFESTARASERLLYNVEAVLKKSVGMVDKMNPTIAQLLSHHKAGGKIRCTYSQCRDHRGKDLNLHLGSNELRHDGNNCPLLVRATRESAWRWSEAGLKDHVRLMGYVKE